MKLVLATPLFPPEIGGPATYAKLLLEGLAAKGIEVELVKFSEVRRLPKFIRHYAYYRRVLAAARGADAVLALDPVSVGLPALRAAQRAGKPFVVKVVGDYAWEQGRQRFGVTQSLDEFVQMKEVPFPVRTLRRIQTSVAAAATLVIVPSEYLKNVVISWGISADQIEVIYNAVPLETLGVVPEAVSALPRPLVVTAGRLVPWKHFEGVIGAVEDMFGAALAIVGEGPDRSLLERQIKERLPGRAVCTGSLSHSDTLAVMKSADVFVLNSSYEGLSHILIEAQALGVPTVATEVGGNPEVIANGENGLLVPAGDTLALKRAIARVLSESELRVRLSTHAIESAKRFSVESMVSATAATLRKI